MLHRKDGITNLSKRIELLDNLSNCNKIADSQSEDIWNFITILQRVTSNGSLFSVKGLQAEPCLAPAAADALVQGCRLITRLTETVPEIVAGPLRDSCQYWVATGKPSFVEPNNPILHEKNFINISKTTTSKMGKPYRSGIFTSTGMLDNLGMWRMYLELNRGSTLHPLPWHVWSVEPQRNLVIHEITNASEWVDFVLRYPQHSGEFIYPDWYTLSQNCDAIHMTLRAICATQGLCFPTKKGIVAAPYWDIESTVWLRWCFDSVQLVETVY